MLLHGEKKSTLKGSNKVSNEKVSSLRDKKTSQVSGTRQLSDGRYVRLSRCIDEIIGMPGVAIAFNKIWIFVNPINLSCVFTHISCNNRRKYIG